MNQKLLLFLILIPLFGCAGRSSFRAFDAESPAAALDEIAARRRAFNDFQATMTIALETAKGAVHFKCYVEVERGQKWRIKLTGPLGIDIAIIEIENDRFQMSRPQTGEKLTGFIDEPIDIPELNSELPSLQYLAPILIPIPNIKYPQDWKIVNSNRQNDGYLHLESNRGEVSERLDLELELKPLKISREEMTNGEIGKLSRTFRYKNRTESIPTEVEIRMEGLTMSVRYNSLKLNKAAKSQSQFAPL